MYTIKNKKTKSPLYRKKRSKRNRKTRRGGGQNVPSKLNDAVTSNPTIEQILNQVGITYTRINDPELLQVTNELDRLDQELIQINAKIRETAERKKTIGSVLLKLQNGEIPAENATAENKAKVSQFYIELKNHFDDLVSQYDNKDMERNNLYDRYIRLVS
jgi:hypothetical protein